MMRPYTSRACLAASASLKLHEENYPWQQVKNAGKAEQNAGKFAMFCLPKGMTFRDYAAFSDFFSIDPFFEVLICL